MASAVAVAGFALHGTALAADPSAGSPTEAVATRTVSGTVRDASGHGWPLYATVIADGVPGATADTDPWTGRYSLELPSGSTQQLRVAARYPGYLPVDRRVTLRRHDRHVNIRLTADPYDGSAPGYTREISGTLPTFDGTGVPPGWSVSESADGGGWVLDDPESRGNLTGGDGGFAIVDWGNFDDDLFEDAVLTAPPADFTGDPNPVVTFDTYYEGYFSETGAVEYSTDGGSTWDTAWQQKQTEGATSGPQTVPLPGAAGKADVRIRFHYTAEWGYFWEIDNVRIGNALLQVVPGGLVAGNVTDRNTGEGVNGATVTNTGDGSESATTRATTDDDGLADGFYWMFNRDSGARTYSITRDRYSSEALAVTVQPDRVVRGDASLATGRVSLSAASLERTLPWQGSASDELTVTNTGTAPMTVQVDERADGPQPSSNEAGAGTQRQATRDVIPIDAAWEPLPDLPRPVQDNIAGVSGGVLYSALGRLEDSDTSEVYAYDTQTGVWTEKASAADPREAPAHGWIGGRWYVSGGWTWPRVLDAKTEVYEPLDDTWSTAADNPSPLAGAGSAVLDGKLYAVGGCDDIECGSTQVLVYDPSVDAWSRAADYPEKVSFEACGAVDGTLYCAGGVNDDILMSAYAYSPDSDSWSEVADLPVGVYSSNSVAANGLLLVSGGRVEGSNAMTSAGYAYDLSTDGWTSLPPTDTPVCCGAGALGFYTVGGDAGETWPPVARVQQLTGFDQGGSTDVSWLSERPDTLQLAPGQSAVVSVGFDAEEVTEPGTYRASLVVTSDTPYPVASVPVTLTVQPPSTP